MELQTITATLANGTTTRDFKAVTVDSNGVITLETRDQESRSLNAVMTVSSTKSQNATNVSIKIIDPVVTTDSNIGRDVSIDRNIAKLHFSLGDLSTTSERENIRAMMSSVMTVLEAVLDELEPVTV